ncbi:MAG: hypothetical protein ACRD3L_04735 [Terriglobales bacterium]
MNKAWFYSVALLIYFCLPPPIEAETEPSPCSLQSQHSAGKPPIIVKRHGGYVSAPPDVNLRLTLTDGKSLYHEGEIIPLTLAFTTIAAKKYSAQTRTYDRSGRLDLETFCVTPDARDPLEDYYGSGVFGWFVSGGLSSPDHVLSRERYAVNEELNEWKWLTPGSYTLRVASDRVALTRDEATGLDGPVLVLSNTVRFQVVSATPQWQAEELSRALSLLDAKQDKLNEAEFGRIQHAARILRFLGSEDATRELARRFWSHDQPPGPEHAPGVGYPTSEWYQDLLSRNSWPFRAGLIGSPCREVAIRELNAAIVDGRHPATRAMVETLALLEIQSEPEYKLPAHASITSKDWAEQGRAKVAAYNKIVNVLWERARSTQKANH